MRLTRENIEKRTDMEEIDVDTKKRILRKKTKSETCLRVASKGINTNEERIKSLKTELESLKTEMEEEVKGKMKPDLENKIRRLNRSIRKIEDILERKTPLASNLDMGNKTILNLPSRRDPKENTENYNDPLIVK